MIGPDIWQWWRREIISFYEPVSFWQSIKHIAWLMFWDFLHFQRERQHSQMQWPCQAAWKRFQKTHLRLQLKFYTIATNAVRLLLLINELYVNNSYEDRCLQPWNNCKPQIVIVYCYCKKGIFLVLCHHLVFIIHVLTFKVCHNQASQDGRENLLLYWCCRHRCPFIWPFVCPTETPCHWITAWVICYCSVCCVKPWSVTAHLDWAQIKEPIIQ